MRTKPINIILLGEPAAGKATQSMRLAKKYKLYDFDMGKELTLLRNKNEKISAVLKKNYDLGKLTPTSIVRKILRDTVSKISLARGILFDGHPKMLGEAELLVRLLRPRKEQKVVVIYLSVPLEETIKRMKLRKGYENGKFGKRADDNPVGLRNRVRYYRTNIADVVTFFKSKYPFYKVSGLGSAGEVEKRITKILRNYL